jgi:single-stranded DNA-binding protein
MNHVQIAGRLVRDPEVIYVGATNFPICQINVAVDDGTGRWNRESKKTEYDSGFYQVEVIGDYGVAVSNTLNKGDEVYVVGSLSQWAKKDEQTGEVDRKTRIRATFVQALTGVPNAQAAAPAPNYAEDVPF